MTKHETTTMHMGKYYEFLLNLLFVGSKVRDAIVIDIRGDVFLIFVIDPRFKIDRFLKAIRENCFELPKQRVNVLLHAGSYNLRGNFRYYRHYYLQLCAFRSAFTKNDSALLMS